MKWQDTMNNIFRKTDIINAKQHHGLTRTVHLSFQSVSIRFSNLADNDYLREKMGSHYDA